MLPCSPPSWLTATPMGNALSLNVPSFWFRYRKLGVESLATNRSGQPSSFWSNHAMPRPKWPRGSATPGLRPDLRERPVAFVAEEEVAFAGQAARAALHRDAAVLAGLALAELGQAREIDLHVAADEEVEVAVAVVVREAAARRPAAAGDPGLRRDVGEGAVVVVAVEVIPAHAGHVDVFPAVAVHVGRAHADAPARVADPRLVRDVLELPAAEVAIQRAARRLRIVRRCPRSASPRSRCRRARRCRSRRARRRRSSTRRCTSSRARRGARR